MSGFCAPFSESIRQALARDSFFEQLTPLDLSARQAKSKREYRDRYTASLQPLSFLEAAIVDYPSAVDSTIPEWVCSLDHLLRPLLPTLPSRDRWMRPTVVWSMNDRVEEGLPHTLQTCIILPTSLRASMEESSFFKLLQHEYLHILQRYYRTSFDRLYFARYQFIPCTQARVMQYIGQTWILHRRTNPDARCWYMKKDGDQRIFVSQFYHTTRPHSLMSSDVLRLTWESRSPLRVEKILEKENQQLEHPHERLATELIKVL
jgi:hypothetical protein